MIHLVNVAQELCGSHFAASAHEVVVSKERLVAVTQELCGSHFAASAHQAAYCAKV
jgi:hypothetical protein